MTLNLRMITCASIAITVHRSYDTMTEDSESLIYGKLWQRTGLALQ